MEGYGMSITIEEQLSRALTLLGERAREIRKLRLDLECKQEWINNRSAWKLSTLRDVFDAGREHTYETFDDYLKDKNG